MSLYLCIQNPGAAPPEAFTLLGASTKRKSENANTIGKFGSGNKHGVVTLLRHGISPTVFCGNLRMEFGVRNERINDGIRDTDFDRVTVKYGGKDASGKQRTSTEDLGFVLEYGANDWTEVDLALREFVSNAIDRAVEEGEYAFSEKWAKKHGNFITDEDTGKKRLDQDSIDRGRAALREYAKTAHDYDDVKFEACDTMRARDGFTRVYIPMTDAVRKFYIDRGKWFLHFSEPHLLNQAILPKSNRNLGDSRMAVIYRRGVRVRECASYCEQSLFDYNLENLELDESRKVDDHSAMHAAARALRSADRKHLETYFRSFLTDKKYWEHNFSSYSLGPDPYRQSKEQVATQAQNWQEAFCSVGSDCGVLAVAGTGEMAARKGFKVIEAPESLVSAAEQHGVRTPSKVLSIDDRDGREICAATQDAILSVDYWWQILSTLGMTNGKAKPTVKSFTQIMNAGSQTLGFYRDDIVYLNIDIASPDSRTASGNMLSRQLLATALEELIHHTTGAVDGARDLQDAAFTLAAALVTRVDS